MPSRRWWQRRAIKQRRRLSTKGRRRFNVWRRFHFGRRSWTFVVCSAVPTKTSGVTVSEPQVLAYSGLCRSFPPVRRGRAVVSSSFSHQKKGKKKLRKLKNIHLQTRQTSLARTSQHPRTGDVSATWVKGSCGVGREGWCCHQWEGEGGGSWGGRGGVCGWNNKQTNTKLHGVSSANIQRTCGDWTQASPQDVFRPARLFVSPFTQGCDGAAPVTQGCDRSCSASSAPALCSGSCREQQQPKEKNKTKQKKQEKEMNKNIYLFKFFL